MSDNTRSPRDLSLEEKKELLKKLLAEKTVGSDEARNVASTSQVSPNLIQSAIPKHSREQSDFPLSSSQRRLFFLEQFEPNTPLYNNVAAFRLQGSLDVNALERSLNEIVQRHESLRTMFTTKDGQGIQNISTAEFSLPMVNLEKIPEIDREAEMIRLAHEEAARPMDLANDLKLRATLIRMSAEDHVIALTLHHISSDGWSFAVFLRELTMHYEAFVTENHPAFLPALPIQYVDYACWQQEWLQSEEIEAQINYWKKQLANAPLILELPIDRPRPALQTIKGDELHVTYSSDVLAHLKLLARQEGATLFMLLLAAFQTLLFRYTGQDDIVVGSPIAGRNRPEVQNLIGFFLNTLVLRTDLSNNPTFRELLGRVREVALSAYENQDVPFEKLVELLQPVRSTSHSPLFQVMLVFQNTFSPDFMLHGLTNTLVVDVNSKTSKYDLKFSMMERPQGLTGIFEYNSDLFDRSTIERMAGHLETLLINISTNPDERIANISILPPEFKKLRMSIIPTPDEFVPFDITDSDTISSRFKYIAELVPHNLAIKTDTHRLTYQDLYQKSSQVALTLQQKCSSQMQQVALLFEHDAPMVIGIFGALLAGKAYVPLDPSYPPQRLEYILAQSQSRYILTNSHNLSLAKSLVKDMTQIINIDEGPSDHGDFSPANIESDDLAYILFTSGSTGHPKGVMQSHRNVLLHIRNYTNNLRINSLDRLTLLSSYSFDAAVMAIYGALLNGAALYPYDVKTKGLSQMADWISQAGITIYHSTPTLYRYFMDTINADVIFPKVRVVVLGGEEAIRGDFDLYKRHFSESSYFINGLGPTESTLALQNVLSHSSTVKWGSLPVGYPVEGIEVLFLNEAGEPASLQGEIVLQGQQIALGYWKMPDLTNIAFQSVSKNNIKRSYRTGDFGRLLPDGSLMFLGRKDEQVKIRGFRIELGEIETTLNSHPTIKQSVVVAREIANKDKQLVAYIVTISKMPVEVSDIRSFLKNQLPDYMIPASLVQLDEIPLTPTGKVNRQALPVPDLDIDLQGTLVPPETDTEKSIARIWTEVLNLKQVGIHDNFFELGGHSLLATQVVSRIDKDFQINVSIRDFFTVPTIAQLAKVIDMISWAAQDQPTSSSVTDEDSEEIEL